jgi:hypothetical protein
MITPDSRYVLGALRDSSFLFPLDGGTPRPFMALLPGEQPIRWLGDGGSLLVCTRNADPLPLRVERLDLSTLQRHPVCELMPPDPAGVTGIGGVMFTPDTRGWAYSYFRTLSDLYLVRGLR